jgi:hypothetical protein
MKRLIAFLLCAALCCFQVQAAGWLPLASPGGGGGAVTLNVKGTINTVAGTNTGVSSNPVTVAAGSNIALLCVIFYGGGASPPAGLAVKLDATTSMGSPVVSSSNAGVGLVEVYLVLSPSTGSHTCDATWTSTFEPTYIDVYVFNGVNQTGGTTTLAHSTGTSLLTGATTPASAPVTSATNDYAFGVFLGGGSSWGAISGLGNNSSTALSANFADNYDTGTASVTLTAAYVGAGTWWAVGFDIVHN